jgi:hypothetical protein
MTATIILYINAVLALLGGGFSLIFAAGQVAAGLGIANEKKWGYWLGVALTAFIVFLLVRNFAFVAIINLLFYIALLALLLHPMSRSYRKVWFR